MAKILEGISLLKQFHTTCAAFFNFAIQSVSTSTSANLKQSFQFDPAKVSCLLLRNLRSNFGSEYCKI